MKTKKKCICIYAALYILLAPSIYVYLYCTTLLLCICACLSRSLSLSPSLLISRLAQLRRFTLRIRNLILSIRNACQHNMPFMPLTAHSNARNEERVSEIEREREADLLRYLI